MNSPLTPEIARHADLLAGYLMAASAAYLFGAVFEDAERKSRGKGSRAGRYKDRMFLRLQGGCVVLSLVSLGLAIDQLITLLVQ